MANNLDTELGKIGYVMGFPPKSINGVGLTDDQHKAYIALSGSTAKNMLSSLINSDGWNKIPDEAKQKIVSGVVQQARTNAQSVVMTHGLNTGNDIIKQSLDVKKKIQNNQQNGL